MTHWEYPQAVERFGRVLEALGIAGELEYRGAVANDLVMVDDYDFDFAPSMTNIYIPSSLLEEDINDDSSMIPEVSDRPWRPYSKGGYLDEDIEEFLGFNEDETWDTLNEVENNF